MAIDQEPQSRHDEVRRLMQEDRRPEDFKGRAQLAADKLLGNLPLGVLCGGRRGLGDRTAAVAAAHDRRKRVRRSH
jgi:hypothetical protein